LRNQQTCLRRLIRGRGIVAIGGGVRLGFTVGLDFGLGWRRTARRIFVALLSHNPYRLCLA
jgi:hypothetical protein